ncbi:recombination and repair protein recT [Caudoviricetes sp.]|nr:recombination and repair protein recT [Caudoviricetes sp.]
MDDQRPEGADNDAAKNAIAERKEQNTEIQATLSTLVEKYAKGLVGDDRAAQFAAQLQLMKQEMPALANCNNDSILAAMMACVHVDLMPNTPEQLAFVIPYGGKATFQLGYKGLIRLAQRSGQVRAMNAELVFEGDKFKVTLGTSRKLVHEPSFDIDRTDYGKVTHAYVTAVLANGEEYFEVMSRTELDKVQETAQAKSTDAPWKKWPEAMAKKTVIKRATKLLPASLEDQRIQYAVHYDNLAEAGRLAFNNGKVIEGEVLDNGVNETSSKTIKAFGSPMGVRSEPEQHTATDDTAEPAEGGAEVQETQAEPPEPQTQPAFELTADEYRTQINQMFKHLGFSDFDEKRYIRKHGGGLLLNKLTIEQLDELNIELEDLIFVKMEAEDAEAAKKSKK